MRLTFKQNWPVASDPVQFFTAAFNILQKELGIAHHDREVSLHFSLNQLRHSVLHALDGLVSGTHDTLQIVGGGTLVLEGVKEPAEPIEMMLSIYPLRRMLQTFCHEMVHVRQVVDGDFSAKGDDVFFRGHRDDDHMNGPPEQEAYGREDSLNAKVLAALSPDLLAMMDADRDPLVKLFDTLGIESMSSHGKADPRAANAAGFVQTLH
jgi:hypothetical protein